MGPPQKLNGETMQVLQHLAGRQGEVVSVEELLREVWADVVVTPDSVYRTISALRRALRDDPKDASVHCQYSAPRLPPRGICGGMAAGAVSNRKLIHTRIGLFGPSLRPLRYYLLWI